MPRPRSSRQHYDVFRRDYREGTLDDKVAGVGNQPAKKRNGLQSHARFSQRRRS